MLKKQNLSQNFIYVFYIVCFAFLLRAVIGIGFFNSFDTYWYRNWAVDLPNGLFSVYARADLINLDYPPLYLIMLYPIGLIYKVVGVEVNNITQMCLLKFWPIVFDTLIIPALYLLIRKKDEKKALFCAFAWALNPAAIFNSAFWGQTDSIMIFFLLLAFWYLYDKRPILACCLFAIAGMVKYQSLFFAPVFLLYLWLEERDKKIFFKGIFSAAATVAVVFLPFMISSKKPLLFLNVYFGGAGTYKYCTLNACNLYGMLGLNWHSDLNFWGVLGIILTAISIAGISLLFIKAKNRSVFAGAFLIMQCIFMFATRMHERYQFAAVIFALLVFSVSEANEFFGVYSSVSIVSFLNQALLLLMWHNSDNPIFKDFELMIVILSVVNVILFIYTVFATLNVFLKHKEEASINDKGI